MIYIERFRRWRIEREKKHQLKERERHTKELAHKTLKYCSNLLNLSADDRDPSYSKRQNSFHSEIVDFINSQEGPLWKPEEKQRYTRWICATTIGLLVNADTQPVLKDQSVTDSLSVSACRLLNLAVNKTEEGRNMIVDRDWLADLRKQIFIRNVSNDDLCKFMFDPPMVSKLH